MIVNNKSVLTNSMICATTEPVDSHAIANAPRQTSALRARLTWLDCARGKLL
jgi:hypothetical protein